MDGDGGLDIRDWGYYDPPLLKSHASGLQMMTNIADRKPLIGDRDATIMANGGFTPRDCGVSSSQYQLGGYMRDAWVHKDDNKFFNMLPSNPSYAVLPETTHHLPLQMLHQPESSTADRVVHVDEIVADSNNAPAKKRVVGKAENASKAKKSKKGPNAAIKDGGGASVNRAKPAKKVTEVIINGIDMDISSIPIPVCSCTATPQQCYRWGSGGWQSACCTTGMSMYPLPMSLKRRGARIAGRKMSLGAFKKVLEKLAAEGYNFSNPIDLKTYWAKHGTNKFVTIR